MPRRHAALTETPHASETLTPLEQIAVRGVIERNRIMTVRHREEFAPLHAELQATLRIIEERLNLTSGSIGTSHGLDVDAMTVTEMPQPKSPNGVEEPMPEPVAVVA